MTITVQIWPNSALRLKRFHRKMSTDEINQAVTFSWEAGEENPFRADILKSKKTEKQKEEPGPGQFILNAEQIMVVANGSELDLIRTHLNNTPWPIKDGKHPVIWFGDQAKFIALNFVF